MATNNDNNVIIKMQNLSWSAGLRNIRSFFAEQSVIQVNIVGGVDGEVFVIFRTNQDARRAMLLNGRYIRGIKMELSLSSRKEMVAAMATVMTRRLPKSVKWIPAMPMYRMWKKDPRVRKMLYEQQRLLVKCDGPDTLQEQPRFEFGSVVSIDSPTKQINFFSSTKDVDDRDGGSSHFWQSKVAVTAEESSHGPFDVTTLHHGPDDHQQSISNIGSIATNNSEGYNPSFVQLNVARDAAYYCKIGLDSLESPQWGGVRKVMSDNVFHRKRVASSDPFDLTTNQPPEQRRRSNCSGDGEDYRPCLYAMDGCTVSR